MAITNKLKVYAETSSNVYGDTTYANSQARKDGAIAGQAISSQLTNTALKTGSLLSVALVDALASLVSSNITESIGVENSISEVSTSLVNIFKQVFLDRVYPVGSIYMSTQNVSPSSFLGGTWEAIQDRFLLAAGITYGAGSTGGSMTTTLTTANLPSHTHGTGTYSASGTTSGGQHSHSVVTTVSPFGFYLSAAVPGDNGIFSSESGPATGTATVALSNKKNFTFGGQGSVETTTYKTASISIGPLTGSGTISQSGSHTHTISSLTISGTSGATGNGASFSNMPAYLSVYMWKRTA